MADTLYSVNPVEWTVTPKQALRTVYEAMTRFMDPAALGPDRHPALLAYDRILEVEKPSDEDLAAFGRLALEVGECAYESIGLHEAMLDAPGLDPEATVRLREHMEECSMDHLRIGSAGLVLLALGRGDLLAPMTAAALARRTIQ